MSCSYADGLSPYYNKGKLGIAEKFDDSKIVREKVKTLARWFNESNHVVIHTGAGISTSAGIPDFRGPKGVWTLEKKGEKPNINVSFNEARPTKTHMAIVKLVQAGRVQFVISQNIDGLHLRSGLPRKHLAELHGNMFIEQCHQCQRQFVRTSPTSSVGQKCLETPCPTSKSNGRPCRGKLHDIILDWEHNLPEKDLGLADFHSCLADLSICLGTTLQIVPSGTLPLNTKKYNSGRLVICNLQPTKYDKRADLLIHSYVDEIMSLLMEELNLAIPEYDTKLDPSCQEFTSPVEWTIPESEVKRMRLLYEQTCCKANRKKPKIKTETECDDVQIKQEVQASEEYGTREAKLLLEVVPTNTRSIFNNTGSDVGTKRGAQSDTVECEAKKAKSLNDVRLSSSIVSAGNLVKCEPIERLQEESVGRIGNAQMPELSGNSKSDTLNTDASESTDKSICNSENTDEPNEESLLENGFRSSVIKNEIISF